MNSKNVYNFFIIAGIISLLYCAMENLPMWVFYLREEIYPGSIEIFRQSRLGSILLWFIMSLIRLYLTFVLTYLLIKPFTKGKASVIILFTCFVSALLFSYGLYYIMYFFDKGSGTTRYFLAMVDSFIVALLASSFTYFTRLNHLRQMTDIENEVLKKEQIRNQFESLKQNMSPHFLFNSLSTLQVLISEDADEAKHYVGHLSSLLRYALQSNVNDLISLAEEINLADAFIFMLRIRYGKNLNIEMNIDPSAKMKKIPPLTLQILLENAVKHNEISKQFPLKIRIEANADKLLTVENNIRIKLTPESSTGTGLPNLSKRYRIISGRDIAVSKENDHFMVAVPLLDE